MDTKHHAPAPIPKPPGLPRSEEITRRLQDQLTAAVCQRVTVVERIEELERELAERRRDKANLDEQIGRFSGRLDARRLARP
jgi:hypothetical protein